MKKPLLLATALLLPGAAFCQNVTGFWQGVLLQNSTTPASLYPFIMRLQQRAGGQVSGYSEIKISGQTYFARMQVEAQLYGSVCEFAELAVLAQNAPSSASWCLKDGALTYNATARTLTGPWQAPSCDPGIIELYRTDIVSDTVFCLNQTKRLAVTGNNVRWYTTPRLTTLLASGNTYTPQLTASATFYVTQTNRNIESQPMPVNVTVTPTNCLLAATPAGPGRAVAVYPTVLHGADAVTVALPDEALLGSTYQVRNVLGGLVAAGALRHRTETIGTQGLAPGVFWLSVSTPAGQPLTTRQLVKQ